MDRSAILNELTAIIDAMSDDKKRLIKQFLIEMESPHREETPTGCNSIVPDKTVGDGGQT